jgi:uncharacterized protein (TIGR03066 family)
VSSAKTVDVSEAIIQGDAMRAARRVLFACLLLALPACASNNKGKIVGKWETLPGEVPNGGVMTLEFMADGAMRLTVGIEKMILKDIKGKYSLGMGDTVMLSALSEPLEGQTASKEIITITGDKMTLQVKNNKPLSFKRV